VAARVPVAADLDPWLLRLSSAVNRSLRRETGVDVELVQESVRF
jgi:hypothetical protein